MGIKRSITAGTALAATAALGFGVVAAAPATAKAGDDPLAGVLVDKNKFDKNKKDYDILTEAVLAVLAEKPDSAVSVLTDGSVRLTAFAPQDRAFFPLVKALTGKKPKSERAAFKAVASLGIDTVETVLLYHVVPGATITAKKALKANGAKLETAQGGTIKVKVRHSTITLKDKDPDLKNPKVVQVNINKGNKQIAHGINRVLLPVNL
ncbi:MAG: fasciclin domain-containing protein [Candidatus Nanopelagicales bacterium]